MKRSVLVLWTVLLASPAAAQQPAQPPQPKLYASGAEVAALVEKAKAGLKPGQPAAGDWIVRVDSAVSTAGAVFPVGHLHLDYVAAVIPNAAFVHERRAEMFIVMDGSGEILLGGTLRDESRANVETRRGSGVEGGRPQQLAKGDVLIIPEGTPHFISRIDAPLVFMSLMIPHGPDAPK